MSNRISLEDRMRVVRETDGTYYPRLFAIWAVLLAVASIGVITAVGLHEGLPDAASFGLLLVAAVVVAHREIVFGDETAISGSMVVACCAVIVFRSDAPLFAPMACGVVAG